LLSPHEFLPLLDFELLLDQKVGVLQFKLPLPLVLFLGPEEGVPLLHLFLDQRIVPLHLLPLIVGEGHSQPGVALALVTGKGVLVGVGLVEGLL